ncbi:class I adenylate-forming enzyme family protein [Pseudomonas sp. MYb185]|uniref:class I adenylate-forming enzyme family protein n=1 Tax=Pseudomonas sp. MYb185 TaxID=1848729 RepID=UPI0026A01167
MSVSADYPITLESPFTTLPELLALHAQHRASHPALIQDDRQLTYAELDAQVNRAAAALQRDGLQPGDSIAICAANSIPYAILFLAALRAGMVVAPLAPSSTPDSLITMLGDSAAKLFFVDQPVDQALQAVASRIEVPLLSLDDSRPEAGFSQWLGNTPPSPVALTPDTLFNVIYSSGTTGEPKGIVHNHLMRWSHIQRGLAFGYGPDCVTLMSTPLYSNTTLVSFLPTIGLGGTLVLMGKFDARKYLELAQEHGATHTMLVPVQYQRIMAREDFDQYDLSSFKVKFSTSAPFHGELKADILARWHAGLAAWWSSMA